MPTDPSPSRTHSLITWSMAGLFIATGLLATLSLLHQKLYNPFGIHATTESGPTFYFGVSIYITIAVTLLTSILIRIALRLTK